MTDTDGSSTSNVLRRAQRWASSEYKRVSPHLSRYSVCLLLVPGRDKKQQPNQDTSSQPPNCYQKHANRGRKAGKRETQRLMSFLVNKLSEKFGRFLFTVARHRPVDPETLFFRDFWPSRPQDRLQDFFLVDFTGDQFNSTQNIN